MKMGLKSLFFRAEKFGLVAYEVISPKSGYIKEECGRLSKIIGETVTCKAYRA